MSDNTERRGSCLCGQTQIVAKPTSHSVGACHCQMCRKWGGGPFMTVDCGVDVSFHGEDNVSVFDSSEWAERGFCNKCGSPTGSELSEGVRVTVPQNNNSIPSTCFAKSSTDPPLPVGPTSMLS